MVDETLKTLDFSKWPRLEAFSHFQVEEIHARLGNLPKAEWPQISGCFVILFTARTGSTFLCREIEHIFDLGKMGEFLNPAQLRGRPVASIVARRKNAWFSFKAGAQGIITAELTGLFDTYIDRTVFIRLVRRDIIAQAVSLVKAAQTKQWHHYDEARRRPEYSTEAIAKSVRKILANVNELREYSRLAGRPCVTLVYEDFANGDFSPALTAANNLGLPLLPEDADVSHRPVERMSDAVNTEWQDRFLAEMSPGIRKRFASYHATLLD